MTGNFGPSSAPAGRDVYSRLIAELDVSGARYRLIEHAPEGRTEYCHELYFNAGRLDRSVALASEDYLRLAQPRLEHIIVT